MFYVVTKPYSSENSLRKPFRTPFLKAGASSTAPALDPPVEAASEDAHREIERVEKGLERRGVIELENESDEERDGFIDMDMDSGPSCVWYSVFLFYPTCIHTHSTAIFEPEPELPDVSIELEAPTSSKFSASFFVCIFLCDYFD